MYFYMPRRGPLYINVLCHISAINFQHFSLVTSDAIPQFENRMGIIEHNEILLPNKHNYCS